MSDMYFYQAGDIEQGPITLADLTRLARQKIINLQTQVRRADKQKWFDYSFLAGAAPVASKADKEYFLVTGENRRGPFTMSQLRNMWSAGNVTARDLYQCEGMAEPLPLSWIKDQIEPPPAVIAAAAHAAQSAIPGPAKSLSIYIALAVVFGNWGIHNFYAGRNREGAIQLILTVTIIGAIISLIWVFIDICSTREDGAGKQMQ